METDNELARKNIEELTNKLKEYKRNLDLTQEIRNHFDEELEKKTKEIVDDYEDQLSKKEENHRSEIQLLNEHIEFNDEKKD